MEDLSMWLLIFAGATVALLGIFLLDAERELKKQRHAYDVLRATQNLRPSARYIEAQPSEIRSSAELITQNKDLLEQIASLTRQLEDRQKTVEDLRVERDRSASAQSENQRLEESIIALKNQLQSSQDRLTETIRQNQDVTERNVRLESELAALEQQLRAEKRIIQDFQSAEQILPDIQSENQKLRTENQQLQQKVATLRSQLETSIAEHKEVFHSQSEMAELREEIAKLTMTNKELLRDMDLLSRNLATSERTIEELHRTKHDTISENQQLHAANDEFQKKNAYLYAQLHASEAQLNGLTTQAREFADANSKLQNEVADLKQQLRTSHRTITELQIGQNSLRSVESENQQLRDEIANLKNHLHTTTLRAREATRENQEAADAYARLQTELTDMKRQLDHSRAAARELEMTQQRLVDVESREMISSEQQARLEAQIAGLQRELSAEKEKAQDLDIARRRLAEMERVCQELREEKRQFEEEISRWQERVAETQEYERQIATLQHQLDELRAEKISFASADQPLQDNFSAGEEPPQAPSNSGRLDTLQSTGNSAVEFIAKSVDSNYQADRVPIGTALSELNRPTRDASENDKNHGKTITNDSANRIISSNERVRPVQASTRGKWRFGIVPAAVLFSIAGAGGLLVVNKFYGSREVVRVPGPLSEEEWTPIETVAKQTAGTKSAPRVQGTFNVTRSTQVYSGPSESSRRIANIEPGMKINVVNARDGWLEIRSKHGRPPGFVRQEAAVPLD